VSFTTLEYCIFISTIFLLYWFILKRNIRQQNVLILIGSYIFYGWWDWRFLFLIFLSSLVDFLIGQGLGKTENQLKRKILLYCSLATNLGILFLFKYFDFFLNTLKKLFLIDHTQFLTIDIILFFLSW